MVLVPVLQPLRLLLISALRISLMLLLLLLVLHALAPVLVTAWLILYHCVVSCYVATDPATSPLPKTAVVGLLEGSLLLVMCPLLGVGRLCLPLLRWGRLGCLPFLRGGRWGSIHVHVLVLPHVLICLHIRVLRLLHMHRVKRGSALPHGRHLELQCIHRSLQCFILGSCRRIVFTFLCRRLGQSLQRLLKVFKVVCEALWHSHSSVRSQAAFRCDKCCSQVGERLAIYPAHLPLPAVEGVQSRTLKGKVCYSHCIHVCDGSWRERISM